MARIPVHEKIIDKDWLRAKAAAEDKCDSVSAGARFLSQYQHGGPPFIVLPQGEYQALRMSAHRCFFHDSLLNGIPIILRDDLDPGEWSYKTVPERMEVSNEIWEAIKEIKTPFEWHEFEEALRSPLK